MKKEEQQTLQSVTHLTFDCYGTLIDWRGGIETHLGGLLEKKGVTNESVFQRYVKLEAEEEESYRKYSDVLARAAMKVANSFGCEISEEEANEFAKSVPSWKPFDDTVAALRKIGSFGQKRIILSNIDKETLQETIRRNDLEIDGFITAEETGTYKPSLGHWTYFFQKYAVVKQEVLHVAQSVNHDIIPATGLGLKTAWINRYGEAKPLDVKPSYTFNSLLELTTLFD